MMVNGSVAFDQYYEEGVDWCTTQPCCSECCDTPFNCTNVVSNQTPFTLDTAAMALFGPGSNEIRWEVNQQSGGSGFHTQMAVTE